MDTRKYSFEYHSFQDSEALPVADLRLLEEAREVTSQAYAPYSNFFVGAAILLANGIIVRGTNQENASFPAGICAERVALSTAASLYPGVPILTIAISYYNPAAGNDAPISPCGICRQSLSEYEGRQEQSIRVILSGQTGKVFVLQTVRHLLPLGFTAEDMQ
jgi:cytidine deaminase